MILSVGGNDVEFFKHAHDRSCTTPEEVLSRVKSNVEEIVKKLQQMKVNIVLIVCYEPRIDWDPSWKDRQGTTFAKMFLQLANEYTIPVIGLARTFNRLSLL